MDETESDAVHHDLKRAWGKKEKGHAESCIISSDKKWRTNWSHVDE